jgi:hypothetical protein
MKIKNYILILLLTLSFTVFSKNDSILVFKTYNDYVNKIGESYDHMVNYYGTVKMKITVSKNNKENTIECKKIWGFSYNGHLFRTEERTGQVGELIVKGNMCYYENGIAHLEMIRHNTNHENFSLGYHCYLSKDLSSKLVPFADPAQPDPDADKQLKKFKKANPQYNDLFKAIANDLSYQNIRAKVIVFNRNVSEAK